jgi:signal transduction histidine kinase
LPAHVAARVAAWREAFGYGLLIATLFVPFDFLYTDRLALTLSTRLSLIATLAACWWLLGRVGERGARRVVLLGAAAAAVLTPLTVLAASGTTGARFGFVLAVPFVMLALLPDVPAIAAAAGIIGAVSGGIALVRDGDAPAHVAEWITMAVAVTGVSAYGARKLGALAKRARVAEHGRREVIGRLEESERQRAASERLALVGRLAAGIGHEINNPLSAVKGNVECALEELDRLRAAPAAREALAEALAASARIAWITADMRAFTADLGAPLVPCRVADAIREAMRRVADRLAGAKIELDLDPELPCVRSEPRLLSDSIAQLIAQAVATGSVHPPGAPPTIRIHARRAGGGIEIAIDDEGPRIPAHVLPRVFEPFAAQGEVRGAGLSLTLPLMRELAERGGGRVEAAWHDRGNRFILTLAASSD